MSEVKVRRTKADETAALVAQEKEASAEGARIHVDRDTGAKYAVTTSHGGLSTYTRIA